MYLVCNYFFAVCMVLLLCFVLYCCFYFFFCFFFFKQKTAYEMRISDWSSDVCSSDLGSPWRDLPGAFGNWNTVFKRYRDWVKADVFIRIFEACSEEPDMEYAMVDATIVKVHRHGQGAKGGRSEARRVGNECGSTCRYRWSPYH